MTSWDLCSLLARWTLFTSFILEKLSRWQQYCWPQEGIMCDCLPALLIAVFQGFYPAKRDNRKCSLLGRTTQENRDCVCFTTALNLVIQYLNILLNFEWSCSLPTPPSYTLLPPPPNAKNARRDVLVILFKKQSNKKNFAYNIWLVLCFDLLI